MAILENTSGQPLLISEKYQLLPKRKVMISEDDLKSSQLQNLMKRGFLRSVKIERETKTPAEKSKKKSEEKKAETEKNK